MNYFPNLARDWDSKREDAENDPLVKQISEICRTELAAADITPYTEWYILDKRSEVPSMTVGWLSLWNFKRAWRYWVATGPGIPIEYAEKLDKDFHSTCRVAGYGDGTDPRLLYKGFGVGMYHVDTSEALKALADTIKLVDPKAKERKYD